MEFIEMRKTKEEREAEKAKRQKIRELWQNAGVKALAPPHIKLWDEFF